MKSFFGNSRWIAFAILNLSFCALLLVGAGVGGGSLAKLPYAVLLFAICTSPLPFIEKPNGAFAMLAIATAIYFVTFGLLDTVSIFSPVAVPTQSDVILSPGEVVILIGMSMLIIGFHLASKILKPQFASESGKDWPLSTLVVSGLILWSAGCGANLYRTLMLVADNSNAAAEAGFGRLGVWLTSLLILIQIYAGPLGIVMLAYWWAVTGKRIGNLLILSVVVIQFAVGWVVDTKSLAISPLFIIILTRFLVLGKVRWQLALVAAIGAALVFPILTARRVIVAEAHLTQAQALGHTSEILWRAIEQQDVFRTQRYGGPTSTFLERATDKAAVEIFAANIGKTRPFEMGSTLEPLLYVFIPRVLWSDKPAVNSAQTFNREFHISADPDTYISPTHLGEMYWNFGFAGVIFGMALAGGILGFISVRFDPTAARSLTRVLVIMVTLYELVVNRGGSIGNEYVVWIRTLLLIGILHMLFARVTSRRSLRSIDDCKELEAHKSAPFANLLQ